MPTPYFIFSHIDFLTFLIFGCILGSCIGVRVCYGLYFLFHS